MIKYDYILNSFRQRIAVSGGGGGHTYKKTFTTDDRYTDGWEPISPWQGMNGLISGGYWTGDGVNVAPGIKRPGTWGKNGFVEFSVSLGGPKEGWDNMSAWIASTVISGSRSGSIEVRNFGNNLYVMVRSGNVFGQDLFSSWIPYVDNDPIILRIEMVPLLNGTSEVRYKKDGVTLATEITSNAFIDPQVGFFTEILAGQQNKVNYVDYDFQPYPVPAYKKTFATDDRYSDGWEPISPWQGMNGLISGGYWTGDGVNLGIGIMKTGTWDKNGFFECSVSLGGPQEGWAKESVTMMANIGYIYVFNYGNNLSVQAYSCNTANERIAAVWMPYVDNAQMVLRVEMVPLLNGTSEVRYIKDGVTFATEITSSVFTNPKVILGTELLAGQQGKVDYIDYDFQPYPAPTQFTPTV